jgi:hypothetical protein
MDNSIGDILYIVVMVIALVFSIYKKTKGGNQDGTIIPEREVGDPFDEVFPTFNSNWDEEKTPVDIPVKHPPKQIPTEQTDRVRYQRIDFQRTKKSETSKRLERTSRTSRSSIQRKSTREPESEQQYYWDEEPLNLQNAIIYAEVIKRPDY